MTAVCLYPHALGRTAGIDEFAGALAQDGHSVHVVDLYGGRTFGDLDAGLAHLAEIGGAEEVLRRATAAAGELPADVVHIGFSLGVLPAQQLALTRPGARGAVLLHACVPDGTFGPWPASLPTQVHAMDRDPFFVDDGDLDAARALPGAELFLYPGEQHLFAEVGTPWFDEGAAALMRSRVLELLARV